LVQNGVKALDKFVRSFYGAQKALSAIATSCCVLKHTLNMSRTLRNLVNLIYEEYDALMNAFSAGETITSQRQDKPSDVAFESSKFLHTLKPKVISACVY
jgi:hypothetical protein